MIRQTRRADLPCSPTWPRPQVPAARGCALSILLPAFVTSELKTAFQIGFMLYLPFLVIDLVVSSVLMSWA
jgi:flagellar biosynthetic protein FliP